MPSNYQAHLRAVIAATAPSYGYTLTIWTAGAVSTHASGVPDGVEALLFLGGAVLAFACVGSLAYGHVEATLNLDRPAEIRLWGALHLPAIGLTVVETMTVAALVSGTAVFPLASFTVTATYLLVIGGQFTLADTGNQPTKSQLIQGEQEP